MFSPLIEIIYIIITIIAVGYIFSGIFKLQTPYIIKSRFFDWHEFKIAILVVAPGIILHELAHRFAALAFGLTAYYQIYPTGLLIGIALRTLNFGFILLAPGYVVIQGAATNLQMSLTAFAGPFMNLLLWVIPSLILKYGNNLKTKTVFYLSATKQANKWLFIFNMIPIPPLDGFKVIYPLLSGFF